MDFRRCARSNAVVPLCYTCVTVQGDGQDQLKVEEAAAGTNDTSDAFDWRLNWFYLPKIQRNALEMASRSKKIRYLNPVL